MRSIALAKRFASSNYVNRFRLLEYYNESDSTLENEYPTSQSMLMVDKEPLVNISDKGIHLVRFETPDLQARLNAYGLEIGMLNSCLLDVIDSKENSMEFRPLFGAAIRTMDPPPDSKIDAKQLRKDLGKSLGGHFQSLRMAMYNLSDENDQNLLARFQTLIKWSIIFKHCPTCRTVLRQKLTKFSAKCVRCQKSFYPDVNPVGMCLIKDEVDENVLLVKRLGSFPTLFTLVSGFAMPGERIQDTIIREVCEEIGILVSDIKPINISQSWPMPLNSLMLPFTALASPHDELNVCPGELETAAWFSRKEVEEAMKRTNSDSYLKTELNTSLDIKSRKEKNIVSNSLRYIPPKGAIAHSVIKLWLDRKC